MDLIGTQSKSIRQYHPGSDIINDNGSLTCTTIIDSAMGWFQIVKFTTYDLDEVTVGNDEYIDKLSASLCQFFNNIWLCRYPRPRKVVLDNGY